MPNQRVLVTGGRGLVGNAVRNVAHMFPDLDLVFVSSADADLRDEQDVNNLFYRLGPFDGVIHLAANVGGLFKNLRHPVEMFQDNMMMTMNILRVAHYNGIDDVLCFLSTCVFPDAPKAYPITADMLHDGPPHDSNEGYAYAKRMTEVLCRSYQKQYGRRYFCVVPTNIYGPRDNFSLDDSHVIPGLIHKCYLAKMRNEPFFVSGDGSPLRQFIYSDDVARLVLWAYVKYDNIERPLILAPPDAEVAIADVVDCIVDAIELAPELVVYDHTKPNGQYKKTADTAHLDAMAHGVDFTPLREGIRATVEWFVNAYEKDSDQLRK